MGRFLHAAFAQIKDKGQWDQKEDSQGISEKKKGKGADGVHSHTLGNKGGSPDEDGCYKGQCAPEFVFHKSSPPVTLPYSAEKSKQIAFLRKYAIILENEREN